MLVYQRSAEEREAGIHETQSHEHELLVPAMYEYFNRLKHSVAFMSKR